MYSKYFYGSYLTFVSLAPFIYLQEFKTNILAYTLHQAVIIGSFALTSLYTKRITIKIGMKKMILIGFLVSLIGSFIMMFSSSEYYITFCMCLFSFGSASLYPIIFTKSLEVFPNLKGTASSAIMCMRYLICSSLTAIGGLFFNGTVFSLAVVIFIYCLVNGILIVIIREKIKP